MATKKTVEHSKHFAKVKKYYDKDLWSKARVYKAVECKWITADEYKVRSAPMCMQRINRGDHSA